MNSVQTIAGKINSSGVNVRMKFKGMKLWRDKPRGAADEIERRATEIGPVLEEILHSHRDEWRPDD